MHTYWTSLLRPIDSCQNRVSADKYHLTVSRAQVSTHRGQVFFEFIRWKVTRFQMIAGSSLIFLKFTWNMSSISASQLKFWFQIDLGRENSASYYRQGRQLFLTLLAMITRWSRSSAPQGNQCSIWHFLANLGEQEDWYCTHIAHQWIDRCQNRVSADQYHLTVSRAQSWTIWLHILIYCDQEPLKVKWTKKMT